MFTKQIIWSFFVGMISSSGFRKQENTKLQCKKSNNDLRSQPITREVVIGKQTIPIKYKKPLTPITKPQKL